MIELFINGQMVVLSEDTQINLLYQTPIFTDIAFIQSNRSYNVEIPRNANNDRIFEFIMREDSASTIPYTKLTSSLAINGIPVYENGRAILTDFGDNAYNVTLAWGNIDNFQALFDENLNELPSKSYVLWSNATAYASMSSSYGLFNIDFGAGSDRKYQHPSVKASWILDKIAARHGITIDRSKFPIDFLVPLITKKADSESWRRQFLSVLSSTTVNSTETTSDGATVYMTRIVATGIFGESYGIYDQENYSYNTLGAKNIVLSTSQFTISQPAYTPDAIGQVRDILRISGTQNIEGDTLATILGTCISSELIDGGGVVSDYYNNTYSIPAFNIDIDVSDHDSFYFRILSVAGYPLYGIWPKFADGSSSSFTIQVNTDDVLFPTLYPLELNLPEIKQSEFLKTLMQLNGVFAYPDYKNPNTIKFASASDIGNTRDWSDRLIVNDNPVFADSVEFALSDFAQKNTLDWDNDDEVIDDTSGVITVDNQNIERSREMVKLPFSATLNKKDYAFIPLYTQNDDGEYDYSSVKPRLLTPKDKNGVGSAYFAEEQKFGNIVGTKYGAFQQIVRSTRMPSVRMKLSQLDLYRIDLMNSIYLAQFGNNYAILSIEQSEGNYSQVKLIRI